jgi:hypothetical protein
MIEKPKDYPYVQIPLGTPEESVPKDHPLHKDSIPKYFYRYDGGFPTSTVVVGSAQFMDGKIIQKRAIEFRGPSNEPVWQDRQHTVPLRISEDEVKYMRTWLDQKYKPNHSQLVMSRYGKGFNTYPEPEDIEATLTKFEKLLGIEEDKN